MSWKGTETLFKRIPPEHILPTILFLVTEVILFPAVFKYDTSVQIAAIIAMTVIVCFFLYRFFPASARSTQARGAQLAPETARRTILEKERLVPLDRLELHLDKQLPDPVRERLKEAHVMKCAGNYEQALEGYRWVDKETKNNWKARFGIAFCLQRLKHPDALPEFGHLVEQLERLDLDKELKKLCAACHNQISAIHEAEKDYESAYKAMKIAWNIRPGYPIYLANLMGLAVKADQDNEAKSWFQLLGDTAEGESVIQAMSRDDLDILRRFPWFNV